MLLWIAVAAADDGLYNQLRARDGVSCSDLGVATPELRDELRALAESDVQPSAVPVRAAGCLVSLFGADPVVADAVVPWMTDPARRGLALVVAGNVDAFPEPVAVRIAQAGMTIEDPRWRARVADRLGRSGSASVRGVVAR